MRLIKEFNIPLKVVHDLLDGINSDIQKNIKLNKIDQYMKNRVIDIEVNLRLGNASSVVYGNDLNNEYIKINADYRS